MNLRYSRVRELGASPWKAMKTNCATSSRKVMPFIQRRTARRRLERRCAGFFAAAVALGAGGGTSLDGQRTQQNGSDTDNQELNEEHHASSVTDFR